LRRRTKGDIPSYAFQSAIAEFTTPLMWSLVTLTLASAFFFSTPPGCR
jgi:hypothetical protein